MRANSLGLAITFLFTFTASGQTPADSSVERVLRFVHTEMPQGAAELTNAIRSIVEVRQATLDAESKKLSIRGTGGQVSMAEWLFRELDKAGGAGQTPSGVKIEYAVPGAGNDLVRVLYTMNTQTPQSLQEIVNAVRSVGELQRIVAVGAHRGLVVRGTAARVALAEWLIESLDKPAGGGSFATTSQTLTAPEYRERDGSPSVARVFYPAYVAAPVDLQESVNVIRSIAEIQRVVAYTAAGAIVARGTAEQVALAEWLLNELPKPTGTEAPALKPFAPGIGSGVTRMIRLRQAATPQVLQEAATLVRSKAGIQRVVPYTAARVIALRGTFEQVAAAERLIQEMQP